MFEGFHGGPYIKHTEPYLDGEPAELGYDGSRLEADVVDEDAAEEVEGETPAPQKNVVRHGGAHADAQQRGGRGRNLRRF